MTTNGQTQNPTAAKTLASQLKGISLPTPPANDAPKASEGQDELAKLKADLEAARAENERLKASAKTGLTIKRSEKGAVSVYGLGRYPVTLYWEQWERLLAVGKDVTAFISANKANLATKDKDA